MAKSITRGEEYFRGNQLARFAVKLTGDRPPKEEETILREIDLSIRYPQEDISRYRRRISLKGLVIFLEKEI